MLWIISNLDARFLIWNLEFRKFKKGSCRKAISSSGHNLRIKKHNLRIQQSKAALSFFELLSNNLDESLASKGVSWNLHVGVSVYQNPDADLASQGYLGPMESGI
jgi:hypothetical protein